MGWVLLRWCYLGNGLKHKPRGCLGESSRLRTSHGQRKALQQEARCVKGKSASGGKSKGGWCQRDRSGGWRASWALPGFGLLLGLRWTPSEAVSQKNDTPVLWPLSWEWTWVGATWGGLLPKVEEKEEGSTFYLHFERRANGGGGGAVHGDGRRPDWRGGEYALHHRRCTVQLYTWDLCHSTNRCHPNRFNFRTSEEPRGFPDAGCGGRRSGCPFPMLLCCVRDELVCLSLSISSASCWNHFLCDDYISPIFAVLLIADLVRKKRKV